MLVPVVVANETYGETLAIAREITARMALIEMRFQPPLGTVVTITIGEGPVAIAVRAEVTHHRAPITRKLLEVLRDGARTTFYEMPQPADARLIGVRFLEFVDGGEPAIAEQIQ